MARYTTYYVWITGKPGVPMHKLPEEIGKHEGFMMGRGCGTLQTALSWARDYIAAGFEVTLYGAKE